MYLISLIIPIYNAEEYLDNTLKTVINQSIGFENIELILVDDNSTDDSKKIIEKYAEKHDNIVPYYSKQNHGYPGFGRNIGLKKATADYIMFMDNDDELDVDMCKNLYETITAEDADIVCCNFLMIDNLTQMPANIKYTNGKEVNNKIIIENDDILLFKSSPVWNKIYKKTIIKDNNIKFKKDTYFDDFIFNMSYFLKSKKLIYLKDFLGYTWNLRSESLSHDVKKEHVPNLIKSSTPILNMLQKENKYHLSAEIFKNMIPYWLVKCSYINEDKKEIKKILREIHNFEMKINLKKLDIYWADTVNFFILHQHYSIAVLFLITINKLRQSDLLRKINRKL